MLYLIWLVIHDYRVELNLWSKLIDVVGYFLHLGICVFHLLFKLLCPFCTTLDFWFFEVILNHIGYLEYIDFLLLKFTFSN